MTTATPICEPTQRYLYRAISILLVGILGGAFGFIGTPLGMAAAIADEEEEVSAKDRGSLTAVARQSRRGLARPPIPSITADQLRVRSSLSATTVAVATLHCGNPLVGAGIFQQC